MWLFSPPRWLGEGLMITAAVLIAGFVTTEYLLVSPAFGVVHIQMFSGLFYAGIAMLSGIVLIWLAQFRFRI